MGMKLSKELTKQILAMDGVVVREAGEIVTDKICEKCGTVFVKPAYLSCEAWKKTRFCKATCVLHTWSVLELDFLRANYPQIGKKACADKLGRPLSQIRSKASEMGLKLDKNSDFHKAFVARGAMARKGKKNPKLAETLKRQFAEGTRKLGEWDEERRKINGERTKKMIADNGHPRGMHGKKHTPETLTKISEASKKQADERTGAQRRAIAMKGQKTRVANGTKLNPHGKWKAGWRRVGGNDIYFRSRWEANYARFLEWQRCRGDITSWLHEPETFWFDKVKRGCVSYLPDFRVIYPNGTVEYHEVKGWMDARSITKIKRMKKYHSAVKLVVIDAKDYRKLESVFCNTIAEWE